MYLHDFSQTKFVLSSSTEIKTENKHKTDFKVDFKMKIERLGIINIKYNSIHSKLYS